MPLSVSKVMNGNKTVVETFGYITTCTKFYMLKTMTKYMYNITDYGAILYDSRLPPDCERCAQEFAMATQPTTLLTTNPKCRIKVFPGLSILVPSLLFRTYSFTSVITGKLPIKLGPQIEINQRG